jgi:hypothetical protein
MFSDIAGNHMRRVADEARFQPGVAAEKIRRKRHIGSLSRW